MRDEMKRVVAHDCKLSASSRKPELCATSYCAECGFHTAQDAVRKTVLQGCGHLDPTKPMRLVRRDGFWYLDGTTREEAENAEKCNTD